MAPGQGQSVSLTLTASRAGRAVSTDSRAASVAAMQALRAPVVAVTAASRGLPAAAMQVLRVPRTKAIRNGRVPGRACARDPYG